MTVMSLSADIRRTGHDEQDDHGADPRQAVRQNPPKEAPEVENDLFFELLEEMYSA